MIQLRTKKQKEQTTALGVYMEIQNHPTKPLKYPPKQKAYYI